MRIRRAELDFPFAEVPQATRKVAINYGSLELTQQTFSGQENSRRPLAQNAEPQNHREFPDFETRSRQLLEKLDPLKPLDVPKVTKIVSPVRINLDQIQLPPFRHFD